jgi:heterotetrameric sarcosine oxidase gamma subunit|tara:strand:- start:482 stop:1069 length:588 start_codon:yes stop_codon:yes gene_type:complete
MTVISALQNVHIEGSFGNFENKSENELLKIKELKNLLIVQIVQYKNSSIKIDDINFNNLKFVNQAQKVVSNENIRVLWNSPNNWLLVSHKKELLKEIYSTFNENDFAVTDLSHSKATIELEGPYVKEVLKKGCPFNFNILTKNMSINSAYNGISFIVDMVENEPEKARIFSLRSFGESLYHSITDASLEFGYKCN